jgi:hypothetical protein
MPVPEEQKEYLAKQSADKEAALTTHLHLIHKHYLALPTCLQVPELTEEQKEYLAKQSADKEAAAAEDVEARGPTSFFHGKADKDYQVR